MNMSSIKDGTANTVVVAETDSYGFKFGPQFSSGTGKRRLRGGEAVFRSAFVFTQYAGTPANEVVNNPPYKKPDDCGDATNGGWFRAGPHSFTPTYLTAWGINTEWPGPSSTHTGKMVQAARADGSVGVYSQDIVWGVWVAVNGVEDAQPTERGAQ
jgi:hypothetical protein